MTDPAMGRTARLPPAPDFRSLFEAAPGLYLVLTPDFRIAAVSDAYLRATLTKRDEIVGRGIFEVFPDNPDDPSATGVSNLRASLQRVLQHRSTDSMAVTKYDIRRPEEEGGGFEERYWSPVNSPVFDADGALAYLIHRVEDVTAFVRLKQAGIEQSRLADALRERAVQMEAEVYARAQEVAEANTQLRQANEELARRESYGLLRAVTDGVPDAIFVKDRAGRYLFINPSGARLLGRRVEDVLGKDDTALFAPQSAHKILAEDRRILADGETRTTEETGVSAGASRTYLTTKGPYRDANGEIIGLIGLARDITDAKQAEERLLQLNEELEQRVRERTEQLERANQAKDNFLASMSHELRTPLNAILGFTGTLLMQLPGPLLPDQQKQLSTVQASARHLLSLINDLLDLAKIESGRIELQHEPVVLQGLVADVVTTLRPLAQAKGLQLNVQVPQRDLTVHTDRRALHQLLLNIAGNAIKYTEHGEVRITLASSGGNAQRSIQISVADTGIGIRPEDQARLFQAFTRIGNSAHDRHDGTGLGLHLSRKLAALLGGELACQSEYGRGSTFRFTLRGTPETAGVAAV